MSFRPVSTQSEYPSGFPCQLVVPLYCKRIDSDLIILSFMAMQVRPINEWKSFVNFSISV